MTQEEKLLTGRAIRAAMHLARLGALRECLEIAKDFTGQGVLIAGLIQKRIDKEFQND